MHPKNHIDTFGATSLIGLALLLAFNQVVIKVASEAFQPVFFAGARSAGAVFCILIWMWWRGMSVSLPRAVIPSAILIGLVFSVEFLMLFTALDLTSVSRASVIFYSMPVWLALSAHFIIPGDRLTARKSFGLLIAFTGVAWAILDQNTGGETSLIGDLCALGAAIGWAITILLVKATPLKTVRPEVQLFYQVLISAVVLLAVAPLFGPLIRNPTPIHYAAMAFQIVAIATFAFIFWLWLMSIYPASGVASFSFLSPVLSVLMGWFLLGEKISVSIIGALILVVVGIALINRAPKAQVPQKV